MELIYPEYTERKHLHNEFSQYFPYLDLMNNRSSISQFNENLYRDYLSNANIDDKAKYSFYSRLVVDDKKFVNNIIESNFGKKYTHIYDDEYSKFLLSLINSGFSTHYKTYIYPEESRLLYYLTRILKPKKIVVLGSYFGFWASFSVAAMSHYANKDGVVDLFDVDPLVCHEANKLLSVISNKSGIRIKVNCVDILEDDSKLDDGYDLVLLDAETPIDYPDDSKRDKAIYAPLLKKIMPFMSERFLLVAHNILLQDNQPLGLMQDRVKYNNSNMKEFIRFTRDTAIFTSEVSTTEGVGIYGFAKNVC